jgi:hypothetical protein
MSRTMNSVSSCTSARGRNGVRQYMSVAMSAVFRVDGSRSCTDVPMRVQSTRGLMFPAFFASGMGRTTRSSLQMGTISQENENLKLLVDVWISIEISSSDFLMLTGTTALRKSQKVVA